MSWWVMEQVSVNEDGTQSLVNIQCDNVSDLPSPNQTATAGYTIVRGSQATVLATSEKYILGGAGTWVKIEDDVKLDLAGYATEQYVDDGLADKVDISVYSSGQTAQDIVIATKITAADVFGIGSLITDSTDLNDYTVGGKYYGPNSAGSTVANLPVANGNFNFSMEVKNVSTVHTLQYLTILRTADNPYIYRRRYYNGTWTSWYRFEGVQV